MTTKKEPEDQAPQKLVESLSFVLQADGFPIYMLSTDVPLEVQLWKWIAERSGVADAEVASLTPPRTPFPELEKVPQNLSPAAQVIWELGVPDFLRLCGAFSFYTRDVERKFNNLPDGLRVFVFLLR